MREINGEKYYVSLGYIEGEKNQEITPDKIKSLIMDSNTGTVYTYEEDEKVITLPIMQVNEILKNDKENIFNFKIIVTPYKTKWVDGSSDDLKINVVGLFAVKREDGIETIRNVQFYNCSLEHIAENRSLILLVEASKDKILGE